MRKIALALLLFFSLNAFSKLPYEKYPSFGEVVEAFFSKYKTNEEISLSSMKWHYKFAKKPTGWHIVVMNQFQPEKIDDDFLFWASEKKKYQKLAFEKQDKNKDIGPIIKEYMSGTAHFYYNLCPYFGYNGWEWDVIQEYKTEENLPDSMVYALGRAYSWYASNLLNDNSGMVMKEKQFKLEGGKMSDDQLVEYRKYRHQAIAQFEKAAQLNPNMEVLVGSIHVKAANEYMTSFLDIRCFHSEEEAMKELKDNLYSKFYHQAATNFLNSCAPNAILLTNGDNDTYPLLYVQAQYNIRPDVRVLNLSLLNTTWYINHLRDKVLDSEGLEFSFSNDDYSDKSYVAIQSDTTLVELSEFMTHAQDKNNASTSRDGDPIYYGPSTRLKLTLGEDQLQWNLGRLYILRNRLAIYDLLATEKLARPIYFCMTVGSESYYNLDDYLQVEGLAYRLTKKKQKSFDNQAGKPATDIMYDNLMTKFDWDYGTKPSFNQKLMVMNYRNLFSRLANALYEEEQNEKAVKVLDKCLEVFPNDMVYFDRFTIPIIETYYELGQFEKGNQMANTLIDNLNNDKHNYKDLAKFQSAPDPKTALMYLKVIVDENKQSEYVKGLENVDF